MLDMCGQHGVHVTYYWITTCYIHEYIKYIGPPFKKIFQENISHLRVFIAISKRRYGIMSHCRDLSMWKFMHYKYMMIWFLKQRCTCYLPKCIWSKRGQLHMPCFGPTLVWNGSKHFFFHSFIPSDPKLNSLSSKYSNAIATSRDFKGYLASSLRFHRNFSLNQTIHE